MRFGYELPDDRFRQPYMARQVKVTFEAEDVPAFGYCTCYLEEADAVEEMAMAAVCESESAAGGHSLTSAERVMENEFLRVEIHGDGSYSVTEKESGKRYPHVGYYEECGDIGNEYIFIQDSGKEEITTQGTEARIELIEDEPYRCTYRIEHRLMVPAGAEELLERERRQCIGLYERKAGRSRELVELALTTLLRLERSAKGLKVETTIHNTAKDHRIRVMIPLRWGSAPTATAKRGRTPAAASTSRTSWPWMMKRTAYWWRTSACTSMRCCRTGTMPSR